MNIIYVLIIASWFDGYAGGMGYTTQEFASRDKCEAARIILLEDFRERNGRMTRLRVWCMEK